MTIMIMLAKELAIAETADKLDFDRGGLVARAGLWEERVDGHVIRQWQGCGDVACGED